MSNHIEKRLTELGLKLPDAPQPVANYVPWLKSDDFLFVSGQISKTADGQLITGVLGHNLDIGDGQEAAKAAGLNILAQAQAALGSLDDIVQIVRLTGYVAATQNFAEHPQVINGASDLMADVFGDVGKHTRAAVGVASLPLGVAVEIDAIIKIRSLEQPLLV